MSGKASVAASGITKGQWVRVVLEGEVAWAKPGYFELGLDAYRNAIYENAASVVSVEVLPDPEQEWQHGDVVLDGMGRVFVRMGGDGPPWRYLPCGRAGWAQREVDHDAPARPLTLLVRDGKPVSS